MVEGEDAPSSSVRSIPMIAPNLVVMVRVLWVILRHHKQDVYWMVADLTFGKKSETSAKAFGMPHQGTWIGKRIGSLNSPEGRDYRVKSQAIREAPDHYPRLQ